MSDVEKISFVSFSRVKRMLFKARKSRSLVIKKGRVTSKFSLQVQGEVILSIVKSLGQSCGNSSTTVRPSFCGPYVTPSLHHHICTHGGLERLCNVCGQRETLAHILSGCKIALT